MFSVLFLFKKTKVCDSGFYCGLGGQFLSVTANFCYLLFNISVLTSKSRLFLDYLSLQVENFGWAGAVVGKRLVGLVWINVECNSKTYKKN